MDEEFENQQQNEIDQFFQSLADDDLNEVRRFLRANPNFDVNLPNPAGFVFDFPISVAIKGNSARLVEVLLKNGANPNIRLAVSLISSVWS